MFGVINIVNKPISACTNVSTIYLGYILIMFIYYLILSYTQIFIYLVKYSHNFNVHFLVNVFLYRNVSSPGYLLTIIGHPRWKTISMSKFELLVLSEQLENLLNWLYLYLYIDLLVSFFIYVIRDNRLTDTNGLWICSVLLLLLLYMLVLLPLFPSLLLPE